VTTDSGADREYRVYPSTSPRMARWNMIRGDTEMSNAVFVPFIDDMLDDRLALQDLHLVPYRPELPCYHWLAVEIIPPEEDERADEVG
jgi:hypothetical protein